jgi:hypothetical protein
MAVDFQSDVGFYATAGDLTDLSGLSPERLRELPTDPAELARVVQGLLVHIHWAGVYGVEKASIREEEVQLRAAAATLRRALELDASPLGVARPVEKRVFGNCRHFATLLAALLRHAGVPARARCGFGCYFEKDKYVDHWICERWCAEGQSWIRMDAQIDERQRELLNLDFDPLDLPEEAFWVAGKAWQACRNGSVDPACFGILDMWGQWFVEGNLCRDLAALHKLELLPWDDWGVMRVAQEQHADDDFRLLDEVAAATIDARDAGELRRLFAQPSLRVPAVIHSWTPGGEVEIEVAREC